MKMNESLVKNEGALRFGRLFEPTKIEVEHFVKCNDFIGVDADESSYCLLTKTKDGYFFLYKPRRENLYYAENEAIYEIPREWDCVRLDKKGHIVELMYNFVGFEIFTDLIKTMPYTYIDGRIIFINE